MYKLTVEGLHKSYGDNEVLKGVSLKAKTGDVISLIGASGSGKSTFLRCINFLETPNDGAMTLDGQPIRMVSDRHGMRVADDAELQRLRDDWRPQMLLLGGGSALIAYVPVINLVAPAYAGLTFVHYMLETLRRHRLKYGVTVLDADAAAAQRKLP